MGAAGVALLESSVRQVAHGAGSLIDDITRAAESSVPSKLHKSPSDQGYRTKELP